MSPTADIVSARRGDRAAFARLHARYVRLVHGVLLSRLSEQEAEEAVQDVFITAWLRLGDLAEPDAFPGWLCAIARNRATDLLRARKPRLTLAEEPRSAPVPGAEAREALAAIQALPEAYRETLVLRLVHDLSGPEIAALTGMTEGSVRVNLHRGMAALREQLGGVRG